MPELPEVETIKRELEKKITGGKVKQVFFSNKKLRSPFPKNLIGKLQSSVIHSIERRAKYILIFLSSDYVLVLHLGMSGKILFKNKNYKAEKHDHFILDLEKKKMVFNDARRFGLVTLIKKGHLEEHKLFKGLGIEPLEKKFNADHLTRIFKNKKQPIKQALMDGRNIVGIGNIYASESLFRAKINPESETGKINGGKFKLLTSSIKQVLKEAIKSGGSTLRDYVRSDGDTGYFQHEFKVYGREKQPCFNCGAGIKRIVQQGRSTYFCPNCQKD